MDLFLDFIQIFRRIMIILAQNKVSLLISAIPVQVPQMQYFVDT